MKWLTEHAILKHAVHRWQFACLIFQLLERVLQISDFTGIGSQRLFSLMKNQEDKSIVLCSMGL